MKKNRIGFIGNPPVSEVGSKDNTGNNVHGHAARDLFLEWKHAHPKADPEYIEKLRSEITHLGFIAATMLHTKRPPSYIEGHVNSANFIEKLDLPVIAFGFGCHAMLDDTIAKANVDERSIRLLRVIAERSKTVGVRGEFTADLCKKYGVNNVTVIGCQSAYIAAIANVDKPIPKTEGERPVINLSLDPDERPLLRLGITSNAGIISQGDTTEEKIVSGELTKEDFAKDEANKNWVAPFLVKAFAEGNPTREQYHDYIKNRFQKFYNVLEWREYIAENYDFCLGTRFHGNMVALQAGVPATWVKHDMRTKELCEHLNLPSLYHNELWNYKDIHDLARECSYDSFWQSMPARTQEFLTYLEKNEVADLLAPRVTEGFGKIIKGGAATAAR